MSKPHRGDRDIGRSAGSLSPADAGLIVNQHGHPTAFAVGHNLSALRASGSLRHESLGQDTSDARKKPLTRPTTADESAVFGHPLPKGEGCFDKNEETAEDPAATYLPICPSANLPASRLDQAFLHREQHQFRRAVEVEGFHDAGAVHGDRIDADIKQCSNFLIGFSLSD